MDMESLEKAAAAAAPDDEDTVYVQQPERPRIKKRSRRFKCALHLRAAELRDLTPDKFSAKRSFCTGLDESYCGQYHFFSASPALLTMLSAGTTAWVGGLSLAVTAMSKLNT